MLHIAGDVYDHYVKVLSNSIDAKYLKSARKNFSGKDITCLYTEDVDHWDVGEKNGNYLYLLVDEIKTYGMRCQRLEDYMTGKAKTDFHENKVVLYPNNKNFYPERYDMGAKNAVNYILEKYSKDADTILYQPYTVVKDDKYKCKIKELKEHSIDVIEKMDIVLPTEKQSLKNQALFDCNNYSFVLLIVCQDMFFLPAIPSFSNNSIPILSFFLL